MHFRFTIPHNIHLVGDSRDALNISASFVHKGYSILLTFSGEKIFELEKVQKAFKFYRVTEGLNFILTDKESRVRPLDDLIRSYSDLLLMMRGIAGRVFSSIRNFAVVPELPETLPKKSAETEDVETELRMWAPGTSTDGESWTKMFPPDGLLGLDTFASGGSLASLSSESADLNVFYWPDVCEALEGNKEPPPELEFYTNTIGHVRQKNYRLAILESIICLEIVLTQFLTEYLTVTIELPKRRLIKFLSSDIGLTARLSALLNLTLHQSFLQDIDLDKVIKVVEWRNRVMHKTGRLPAGIPEDALRDGIFAVLSLVKLLAERRDNAAAGPELQIIREALHQKEDKCLFQIWLMPSHRVRIDIEFFTMRSSSEYRKFIALVEQADKLLKNRDEYFEVSKHLTIHFKVLGGETLGWFIAGSLRMVEAGETK